MANASMRTAAAGGTDPQATNVAGLVANIITVITAAGWTQIGTSGCYYSVGEAGTEAIYMAFQDAGGGLLRMYNWQYHDGTDGYNGIGGANSAISDFSNVNTGTYDYVIRADLDSVTVYLRRVSDSQQWAGGGGTAQRGSECNGNVMVNASGFGTGTNVTVDVTPSSPVALGYNIGDQVMVVSQQSDARTTVAGATKLAPAFTALIVDVGANSIVLDRVPEAIQAGARIGEDPSPYYLWYTAGTITNFENNSGNGCLYGLVQRPGVTNIYNSSSSWSGNNPLAGYISGMGSGFDGITNYERRTGRDVLAPLINYYGGDSVRGWGRGIYRFCRTSSVNTWDVARTVKAPIPSDYIVFLASSWWMAIGPV